MSYLGTQFGDVRAPTAQPSKVSATTENLSERRKWIVLMAVSLVTAVEISNRLSINVLLPDMQGNVAATSDQITWVLTLYNVGFICSMALSAGMRRVMGARKHFLFSIALYSTGAIGCFLSEHSLTLLLVSRVVMGFGGGAFLVRLVVLSFGYFPGIKSRIPMTYALLILFGAQIVYPTAMGMINDAFHWNYAFLLDFPFLAVGALVILKYMPAGHIYEQGKQRRFDFRGTTLLIISIASLQAGLNRGEQDMWFQSPWIVGCLALAVVSFVLFLIWELHPRNDQPVLHLRKILETRSLTASFALVMVLGAIMATSLYILPQYLRTVQNFSATQTGEFFGVYAAGLCVGGLLTLRIFIPRWGGLATSLLGLGIMITAFSASIDSWTPDTPSYLLAIICMVGGFALGPLWFGVANLAIGQIDLPHVSEAEATYYFVRQLGNSFGVTAASVLYDRRLTFHSARLLDVANRLNPVVPRYLSAYSRTIAANGGGSSSPTDGALQIFQNLVVVQTRLLAYVDISFCLALLSGVGILLALSCRTNLKKALHFLHLW
jgi:MFS transporter, DHA2 family, multidrug resistance protein